MDSTALTWTRRAVALLHAWPWEATLRVLALGVSAYVIGYPFLTTRYPPMTDLPFHAAEMSILRHYLDPAYRFHEQFTVHPLEVPYMSMYVVGALLALLMPVTWAAKGMSLLMLALLPAGLAVLFHGMKKTPLWGLLGLGLVWTKLSHWGWLNFIGSLGLYAMAIGCALLVLDQPSRRRKGLLLGVLLAVFFTHVYRVPFALLAVLVTTGVMYPATRRVFPVVLPVSIVGAMFALWWLYRPEALAIELETFELDWDRLRQPLSSIFAGYRGESGAREQVLAKRMLYALCALFLVSSALVPFFGRTLTQSRRDFYWSVGVTVLPLLLAGVHLFAFLTLPMRIGEWWNVYPRELEAAAFIVLAAMPDMPKRGFLQLPAVAMVALFTCPMAFLVAEQWQHFERVTSDFRGIRRHVPRAPRLLYLIFDHSGTDKKDSPFVHLPAWIQAEKGGWLSFHFAGWRLYPIRYRENSAWVPPPFERNWEWNPHLFDVMKRGVWFDVFLVRSKVDPSVLFKRDATIRPLAQNGTWWLFDRQEDPEDLK
jgi:hypothetical protein